MIPEPDGHPVTAADFETLARTFDTFAREAETETGHASIGDVPRAQAVADTWRAAAAQVRGYGRGRFPATDHAGGA